MTLTPALSQRERGGRRNLPERERGEKGSHEVERYSTNF